MQWLSGEDFQAAVNLLFNDQTSKGVFELIQKEGKASGWEMAKKLDRDPGQIRNALESLKRSKIVDAAGSGLEGYYYLTDFGFRLVKYLTASSR